MIWGAGTADGTDHARLQEFKGISHTPPYIIGFEEPDCAAGSGSAGFDVATGKYIRPFSTHSQRVRDFDGQPWAIVLGRSCVTMLTHRCRSLELGRRAQRRRRLAPRLPVNVPPSSRAGLARPVPVSDQPGLGYHQRAHQQGRCGGYPKRVGPLLEYVRQAYLGDRGMSRCTSLVLFIAQRRLVSCMFQSGKAFHQKSEWHG